MDLFHAVYASLYLLVLLNSVSSRLGFKKDVNTDFEFPPRILQTFHSNIPVGHLRPLGWQRKADGRIAEETGLPIPKQFYKEFVKHSQPVVFRDAMKDVPAMKTWDTDSYLKKTYGEMDVHVSVKKERKESVYEKVKFKKFLREYEYEDWYLSNIVPLPMMRELLLPRCLKCGFRRLLWESEIWFSSGGTASLLHSHADHNLHCLLAGRKDFIVVDQQYRDKVHFKSKKSMPDAGHSPIDTDMVNMFKYNEVAQVPWRWSTLQPGDCIYIPAGQLHQVRSWGRSFSSTILWTPVPKMNFTDCKGHDLDTPVSLSDVTFFWTYTNGDRHLTNYKMNEDDLVEHLLLLMRKQDRLAMETFEEFYTEIMSESKDHPTLKDVWKQLDPNDNGYVTREEVTALKQDVLRKVSAILNEPHKHHGHEPLDQKIRDEL